MLTYQLVVEPCSTIVPLLLSLLYLGGCVASCINTGLFYQNNKEIIPAPLVSSHLAFCAVGTVVFVCFSAVFWLWSMKYSFTRSEQTWRLFVGLWAVSVLKDLPLFVVESMTVSRTGWWVNTYQCVCYIIQIVFLAISITVTGMSFSWYTAGFLERVYGQHQILHIPHSVERPPSPTQRVAYPIASTVHAPLPDDVPPILLQERGRSLHGGVDSRSRRGSASASASASPSPGPWSSSCEPNCSAANPPNSVQESIALSGSRIMREPDSQRGPPDII